LSLIAPIIDIEKYEIIDNVKDTVNVNIPIKYPIKDNNRII